MILVAFVINDHVTDIFVDGIMGMKYVISLHLQRLKERSGFSPIPSRQESKDMASLTQTMTGKSKLNPLIARGYTHNPRGLTLLSSPHYLPL